MAVVDSAPPVAKKRGKKRGKIVRQANIAEAPAPSHSSKTETITDAERQANIALQRHVANVVNTTLAFHQECLKYLRKR